MTSTKQIKQCVRCYEEFVPRNKHCDLCSVCKKPNKCQHGTSKGRCKIDGCFGNEICEHKQHNQKCVICRPGVKELDKLNSIIRRIINKLAQNSDDKCVKIQQKTKDFLMESWCVQTFDEVI